MFSLSSMLEYLRNMNRIAGRKLAFALRVVCPCSLFLCPFLIKEKIKRLCRVVFFVLRRRNLKSHRRNLIEASCKWNGVWGEFPVQKCSENVGRHFRIPHTWKRLFGKVLNLIPVRENFSSTRNWKNFSVDRSKTRFFKLSTTGNLSDRSRFLL